MSVEILKAGDLEGVRPDKVMTLLFGYRARLLRAARDDEYERKIIFDSRAGIAAVFKQFGGERHQESVRQFESLKQPDDLLKFTPPERAQNPEPKERVFRRPGFYVFGEELDGNQIKSIRSQNRTGLKAGNPIQITLLELFRVANDRKPIYINQPMTDRLQKQLAVLIRLRPELAERLTFLLWEDGQAIMEPYASCALVATTTADTSLAVMGEAMRSFRNYIYHSPRSGEIFVGRVSKVVQSGIFVEFLPGYEGLVHQSEFPKGRESFEEGEAITVEVISIDGRCGLQRIKLSAKSAETRVKEGAKPLFADMRRQLLLTDGAITDELAEAVS